MLTLKKLTSFFIFFFTGVVAFSQTKSYCAFDNLGSKYEINLKQGTGSLTYNKYSSSGSLIQSLNGTWDMRNEGVYGDMYKVVANINGNTIKWIVIHDANGNTQELRDESAGRVWSPCVSKSNSNNNDRSNESSQSTSQVPSDASLYDRLLGSSSTKKSIDKKSIIGKPIKIGNLSIAQNDFPEKINWNQSKLECSKLGNGWRLPTKQELLLMYKNKYQIGNFQDDSYWSATRGKVVIAWRLNFDGGELYDRDNTDNTANFRPVKSN
jgi:hypothetical protein